MNANKTPAHYETITLLHDMRFPGNDKITPKQLVQALETIVDQIMIVQMDTPVALLLPEYLMESDRLLAYLSKHYVWGSVSTYFDYAYPNRVCVKWEDERVIV